MSPGPGPLEGRGDRRRPVADEQQVAVPPPAGVLGAAGDLVEDRVRVLAAGVLVGRRRPAGRRRRRSGPSSGASRCRAPPPTRTPRSARRRGPPRAARAARGPSRALAGRVGVVDDDAERLAASRRSIRPGTPVDGREARHGPPPDRGRGPRRARHGGERVVDVEPAGQAEGRGRPRRCGATKRDPEPAARPPRRGWPGRRPPDPCRRSAPARPPPGPRR